MVPNFSWRSTLYSHSMLYFIVKLNWHFVVNISDRVTILLYWNWESQMLFSVCGKEIVVVDTGYSLHKNI